jgi:hypothetical protein
MPDDHDHLAFDIKFALTHGPVSMATRKFVRGLSEHDLEYLCGVIAEKLWRSRWRRLPPEPIGPSAMARQPKGRPRE